MSTIIMQNLGLLIFICSPLLHAGEVFDLDFRRGESTVVDWEVLFSADSAASNTVGSVKVESPPGNVEGDHTALVMRDLLDSSKDKLSNEAGTPVFTCSFESIPSGELFLRVGTSGTQNQNGSITLLAKGRPLLILRLVNNHEGVVVGGEKHFPFEDETPWFNRARDFSITWDASGFFTVDFVNHEGDEIQIGPVRPLAPGAPDQLQLQVGFGRAVDKAIRFEHLRLIEKNNS